MTRRTVASIVISMLTLIAVALPSTPASAAVSFAKGTLTITGGNGDDVFDLDCGGGKVLIPAATGVDCDKVEHIVADLGRGNDMIEYDMMFVPSAEWGALVKTTTYGGPGSDRISGSGTRDVFYGQGYADRFNIVDGNDVFVGGPGWDIVQETCDCDMTLDANGSLAFESGTKLKLVDVDELYLTGGPAVNFINIGPWPGESAITGMGGSDNITGGSGRDDITAGNGGDSVAAGGGDDVLTVDEGVNATDTFGGGSGNDRVFAMGMSANSTLTDSSLTGFGSDSLSSIEAATIWRSAGGTTNASGFSGPVIMKGSSGGDTLVGGGGDDYFEPDVGVDTVDGNAGADFMEAYCATSCTLTPTLLTASGGGKTLSDSEIEEVFIRGTSGGGNTYLLSTFPGRVTIQDGGGADTIVGNGQTTFASGDHDAPVAWNAPDQLVSTGRTVTMSGVTDLTLSLGGGGLVDLIGFTGNVNVFGSPDADQIATDAGADWIAGGSGNDKILAGDGKDKLYGQAGRDTLNGQGGRDGCNGAPGTGKLISCEVAIKPLPVK